MASATSLFIANVSGLQRSKFVHLYPGPQSEHLVAPGFLTGSIFTVLLQQTSSCLGHMADLGL